MMDCVLGIDFAFSKIKKLPIAILTIDNEYYNIQTIPNHPPKGPGIQAVFYPEMAESYFKELRNWFVEIQKTFSITCIALDCPTKYCPEHKTIRQSENAILKMKYGIFKTPKKSVLDKKIQSALTTLNNTKANPHSGFSIWMGFAIEFSKVCSEFAPVIEVFPNWFWKNNIGMKHKSQPNSIQSKLKLMEAKGVINPYQILEIGFGKDEDKVDSLYCALCASKFSENKDVMSVGEGNDLIFCVK